MKKLLISITLLVSLTSVTLISSGLSHTQFQTTDHGVGG